jgi:hypothetical protein
MSKQGRNKKNGQWKGGEKWDVSGEAKQVSDKQFHMAEPLQQVPYNGGTEDATAPNRDARYPAIYGVDLEERRRQKLLSDIAGGQNAQLKAQLGNRQVMLDEGTTRWLIEEQDRIALIQQDEYFEKSAAHLFANPNDLKYLKEIKPDYWERRVKLAKWVSEAQLKIFDIMMNGVQSQEDFQFAYMLQSLDEKQKALLKEPVWNLTRIGNAGRTGKYQPGLFRKPAQPNPADRAPWSGIGGGYAGLGMGGSTRASDSLFSDGVNPGRLFSNFWS